jgi:hypothetical protein
MSGPHFAGTLFKPVTENKSTAFRAVSEQLRHYESFMYVIDMVGKGALQACDQALQ